MKRYISTSIVMTTILLGCSNLFENVAEKEFDKALYYQAQQDVLNGEYDDAIDIITHDTSDDFQTKRKVKFLLSQAYAGACGLDALDIITAIQDGASNILPIFLDAMTGTTVTDRGKCDLAITTLETIGDSGERSASENFFMVFAAFARIGAYLSVSGDADDDGAVDATFDPCDNTDLPSAQADAVVGSFAQALEALTDIIADGGDIGSSDIEDILDYCTTVSAINAAYDFCSQTDETTVTAQQRVVIRCLVDGPDLGFSISGNDLATCIDHAGGNTVCPGP
ncbi:MAG: hypothetical protein KDD25_04175 [Bdellovibrionales bacterium]|nr:hypothetical protein [Bdellovibrionales bacterium]